MKNILNVIMLSMFLVLTLGFVAAQAVGNSDKECQDNGFDYGIVKYECDGGVIENGSHANSYLIDLKWEYDDEEKIKLECISANWTANPAVDGVISKESTDAFVLSGGLFGTVKKQNHSISHITFCGNYDDPIVPEFGTVIGIATTLGALGVFFLVRRK